MGGSYNSDNSNYYLYNSSINSINWTLSPSYYDETNNAFLFFVLNDSNGRLYDEQVTMNNSIRPVITLDTNRLSGGNGTIQDKYTFN